MDNRFHRKSWRRKSCFEDFIGYRQFLSSSLGLMLHLAFFSHLIFTSANATKPSFAAFTFVVEPTSLDVVTSRPARLDCAVSYSGPSQPKISWLKQGGSVKLENTARRHQAGNGSLVFKTIVDSPDLSDKGDYRCAATVDGLGTILSRKARLDIAYLPAQFDEEPGNVRLAVGDTAVFQCLIDGMPVPTITWFKRSIRLQASSSTRIYPSGTLEIGPLTHSDFGPYHCQASVPGRTRKSATGLLMQIPETDPSIKGIPHFIVRPRSKRVVKDHTVHLHCAASGRDRDGRPPIVSWLKDGRTIVVNSDKNSSLKVVGAGTLVLTQVQESDSGVYTCRAVNQEDSVDADATLSVLVPPQFKRKPQNKVAYTQSDVTLTCNVIGDPYPTVTWLKNGDALQASDYFKLQRDGSLLIQGLIVEDAGIYQCLAENELAQIQASCQLVVQKEDPPFTHTSSPTSFGLPASALYSESRLLPPTPTNLKAVLVSTRFVTLAWHMTPASTIGTSSSGPEPMSYSIFWRENGSERERVSNTTLQEYNIQGLKPGTAFEIRVRAYNRHGPSRNEAKIQVKTADEAIVSSPPRDVLLVPISSTSIKVTWLPPLEPKGTIDNYKLLYYQVGSQTLEDTIEVKSTSHVLRKLLPFSKYSFRIEAVTENGPGVSTEEVTAQTFSDSPSAPPQNFSLEVSSSTSLIARWQPPPKNTHNGVITGYKIRFKQKGGQGQTVMTAGNRKTYALTELLKGTEYQVRITASTVNDSGPFTQWAQAKTFDDDLDESMVPPKPAHLYARPKVNSIIVSWAPPPPHSKVLVRGYVLGYGRGISDVFQHYFDAETHDFTIENLQPKSEYIITIRATNNRGQGPPRFETVITPDKTSVEPATPMVPPTGVNAHVLSARSIMLTWADNSLSKNQKITDNRYYTLYYRSLNSRNKNFRTINSTDLNIHIEGLRPNTKYAFKVKVIKGRRESIFSMMVSNKTEEAAPSTEPKDITPVPLESDPLAVSLNWQPPARPNGQITGYLVYYTNDLHTEEVMWPVEGVVGDRLSTVIDKLTPDTTYHFKVQARNSKGFSPKSKVVTFVTPKVSKPSKLEESKGKGLSTNVIIIISACVAAFVFCTIVIIGIVILCRRRDSHSSNANKNAMKGSKIPPPSVKPPDLWIHQPSHLDLNKMERSQRSESSVSVATSTLRRGSRGSADHTDDQGSTLDRRRNSFVGECGGYPSSGEERYQPIQPRNIIRPKPITLPPDATGGLVGSPNGHMMGYPGDSPNVAIPMRPIYPRTQYNTQYSTAARVNAGDIPHTCTPSLTLASVSEDERSHAPHHHHTHTREPSGSGMEDSFNSRIGYVKPQQNLSPYKKPTPPLTAPVKGQRPSIQFNSKSSELKPKKEDTDMSKSLSTEELTAEMANLEGLMKDLNAITQQEFEC